MDRKQYVIERFCRLSAEVMRRKFSFQKAAACFCGKNPQSNLSFDFSDEVLNFIDEAVKEKLEK